MLTDQGAQFTSGLINEVSRLLSIRQLTTTPYHPMYNRLVERFNGTLKQMLRRMSTERPKDWDRFLNPLLFAYREVPQESLGFSPFEMLYGRTVRGPKMILRELWTKDLPDEEVKSTYQYVMDLREKMEKTCQVATEHLEKTRTKQKKYFNKKSRARDIKPGDKVPVLLPTKANKLLMQWRGPYDVVDRVGLLDFKVLRAGKVKILHVNLLKKYVERKETDKQNRLEVGGLLSCVMSAVVDADEDADEHGLLEALPGDRGNESVKDIEISLDLTDGQRQDITSLAEEFRNVLTGLPGRTNLAEHDIHITTNEPVRVKPYLLKKR